MARTLEDVLRGQIGELVMQNSQLVATIEALRERIAELEMKGGKKSGPR